MLPPSTMTPPIELEVPFIYFDVECITTSAPYFIGFIRYGVVMVESTINIILCLLQNSLTFSISKISNLGFPIASANRTLVFSVTTFSKLSSSKVSRKLVFIP
ncbi:hypothetical protein D3C73_881810 [compost metagenome]